MTRSAPERRDVHFPTGDGRCHAWLYLPATDGETPPPVIVMAHGLGAVKALRLDAFAQRFQAEGYACLVFDYRNFGDSEGEPRELLSIRRQRQDWHAAVAFARAQPEIDGQRVVLWGTSFAGGHAITTAAEAPGVVATVAQCPFTDGLASSLVLSPRTTARLTLAAIRDFAATLVGASPVRVKVAARPGELGLMSADDSPDVFDGIVSLLHASGMSEDEYRNDVPARVGVQIPFYAPGRKAARVRCPILFCVCDHDTVAPAEATLRHAAKAPRGQVKRYPVGHFDIYTGDRFEQVVTDQLAFLHAHVHPRNTASAPPP